MCGRYTVRSIQPIAELFGIALPPEFQPRFNIAPTQDVPVVRAAEAGGRRADLLHWGLVPRWAEDPSVGTRITTAGAEPATERPASRGAMGGGGSLAPADGFYEWKVSPGEKRKQPHLIRMNDDRPF